MKMTNADFLLLKASIQGHDTPELRAKYRNRDFPRAEKVVDLNKRYRWDLLHKTGLGSVFYSYLNDDHIDTALRAIVGTLDDFVDVKPPIAPKVDRKIHDPWGLSNLG